MPVEDSHPVAALEQGIGRRHAGDAGDGARLDDDGVLRYREDRALWGANNWQFVTVRVPADASKAQVMAVINAKGTAARMGDRLG